MRACLSLAPGLLLGIVLAHSGNAQVPPTQEVCIAPAADPNAGPAPETPRPGWLILHGSPVPAPYTVTVTGDTVAVNGILFSQPPASTTASLDPGPHAALFQQFWSLWQGWCAGGDTTGAKQQAVAWWQSAPGVASAALVPPGGSDLRLQFAGDPDYQTVSLQAADDQPPPDDASRSEILYDLAQEVDYALRHGRLLVVESEGHRFTAPPDESDELMAQIQQISTLPTESGRYQALLALLPDARMAASIAHGFAAAQAPPPPPPPPTPTPTQEVSHAHR